MNCRICRSKLALHAGGDLPEKEARKVEEHLNDCADCRKELATYKQSRWYIRELADQDLTNVPDGVVETIMQQIESWNEPKAPRKPLWYKVFIRYGLAACLVATIGFIWYRVSGGDTQYRLQRIESQKKIVQALVSHNRSLISADRLASLSVSGPFRIDEWEPSGNAGIYAVLHKPDPDNRPDLYSVDYLGEAGRIEYKGDPWRRQRINRLTERAGSKENIYIAEYPMPNQSVKERRTALNVLIDTLQPYYN